MFTGREKILGAILVGSTAVLVGYAITKAFSGAPVADFETSGSIDGNATTEDPASIVETDGAKPATPADGAADVQEKPKNRVYTVQLNDSFWTIAKKVYGDARYVNKLCAANAGHKTLRSGMRVICPAFDGAAFKIDLPVLDEPTSGTTTTIATTPASITGDTSTPDITLASATVTTVPAAAAAEPLTASRTHVVQRGESLYDIAKKYYNNGSAWPKIAAANPKMNPKAIKPGDTVQIP